jgi:predicted murein hydrolase (TIGR00659 family)
MTDAIVSSAYFGALLSIAAYAAGMWLKKKFKLAIFNPLLIAILLVIAVLLVTGIDYDSYNAGAKYISYLLTPATVCLAIPLYRQLALLKKHALAVFTSITAGVIASLGGVFALSCVFGLNHTQYVTLLPKSITSAIGLGMSQELGGIPAITVAVIIVTGILGNISAGFLSRLFRINEPLAQGLAIGTASHAIGTARALELGEVQAAMSSLAIVVSGLLTVVGASIFANFR